MHAVGNAVADMRSLPAGLGRTQRPVDRGAGGNQCRSAVPRGWRLPPTRHVTWQVSLAGVPNYTLTGRTAIMHRGNLYGRQFFNSA